MSEKTYQLVTDRILEALEGGVIPWRKPWDPAAGEHVSIDGTRYRGINPMLLSLAATSRGYVVPLWMTFNAARRHGGSVRRGERAASVVVFWKALQREERDPETGEKAHRVIPILRHFAVFNIAQCEGVVIPDRVFEMLEAGIARPAVDPIESAEAILRGYLGRANSGPSYAEPEAAEGCYYAPGPDSVVMVPRHRFHSPAAFYSVAFHECGHSTGHASRLARPGVTNPTRFGSHAYSREELVAELTAAFLCARAGIENAAQHESSVAYLQGWIRALREDARAIVVAGSQAQRAADRILGETAERAGAQEREAA